MPDRTDPHTIRRVYKSLRLIRRFEEEVARIYPEDKIKSPVHLSIGQESVAVGVCDALAPDDLAGGTYRGHATYIAKGGNINGLMAELYGKDTGCTRGKGGSMHLMDITHNVIGSSAVVGTTVPIALGYAIALKREGKGRVVASFMGDGATEEGVFHESLNFAALKRLPVVFVLENNFFAIHTPISRRQAVPDAICERVQTYGIPAYRVTDADVFKIRNIMLDALPKMRRGEIGPIFLECHTYRWREHVGPANDYDAGYRSTDDLKPWIDNDQIPRVAAMLDPDERARVDAEVEKEVAAAIDFAEKSPFPAAQELYTLSTLKTASKTAPDAAGNTGGRVLRYVDALKEAVDQEMERDARVFVMGLDVDDHKALQGSTRGLLQKYGPERIFTTPLAEDAMTGAAIGAAMAGLRPIHVHIRMDFLMLSMNQLINMAAKAHYMYGGAIKVPLVVRSIIGKSWGQGPQHSQGLYSTFMHFPGLKVVAPSNAHDAKGCMLSAIRDDNPVMFVEHRLLYPTEAYVPEEQYELPPGTSRVVMPGDDVTLVGISNMLVECLRARELLADVGVSAEIIDPIWLSPLDTDTIVKSVKKTRRLIVVDNGWTMCGAGSEIAARVAEALGPEGKFQVQRIGFAPTICPTSPSIEDHFYPNPARIAQAAHKMAKPKAAEWTPDPDRAILAYQKQFRGPF